ncbi:uncharacterized protein LOC143574342 [Bidens hawaiensis]|uniref:uncharacterized protein LOC143574342 n=1 Tax=Bidens hawaiensis TaxID=980011 RepID=UPI004049980A
MNKSQNCCSTVGDRLPPLSGKHVWLVAQMLEADDMIGDQVFYTAHDPLSQYQCRVPELLGRRIRGSFHGWVILSNHPHNVMWSLWNPLTYNLISLPPLDLEDGDISECCLPSPPDDPGSILLLTMKGKPTFVSCRLDRKRQELKWTEMSYAKQLKDIIGEDGFIECLTCCNGKVYALNAGRDCDQFIIEIDTMVTSIEVVINVLPFVKMPSYSHVAGPNHYTGPFLKGTCLTLVIVYLYYKWEELCSICLVKLDMIRKLWEEMEDFDDAACFFELDCSSTAIASKSGGGYVHMLYEEDKVMYPYHVKDKTLSVSSMPHRQGLPPPRSRTSYVSIWPMPECRYMLLLSESVLVYNHVIKKEKLFI